MKELPEYYSTREFRISVGEREKWEIVEKAKKHFSAGHKVSDIDGARIEFEHGWALVRASNTGPKISLRMEADSEKELEGIKNAMRSFLKSASTSLNVDF